MRTLSRHERDELLARHYDIDMGEVEREKQAILEQVALQDTPTHEVFLLDYLAVKLPTLFRPQLDEIIQGERITRNNGTVVINPKTLLQTGDLMRMDGKVLGVVKHEDCRYPRSRKGKIRKALGA